MTRGQNSSNMILQSLLSECLLVVAMLACMPPPIVTSCRGSDQPRMHSKPPAKIRLAPKKHAQNHEENNVKNLKNCMKTTPKRFENRMKTPRKQ